MSQHVSHWYYKLQSAFYDQIRFSQKFMILISFQKFLIRWKKNASRIYSFEERGYYSWNIAIQTLSEIFEAFLGQVVCS